MKKVITVFSICLLVWTSSQTIQAQNKILVHSESPSEGLYVVSDEDKKEFGYCRYDQARNIYVRVIDGKYENAHDFHNGLARVKLNGKWGAIDKSGNTVISFKYDRMYAFDDTYKGLAWVKINQKEGLIDRSGREVVPVRYDGIGISSLFGSYEPLKDIGLITVKNNNKFGALNLNGAEVIPMQYDNISSTKYGLIPVKSEEKWGIIDQRGQQIIPFKYERIVLNLGYDNGTTAELIFVQQHGKHGVINRSEKTIVPLEYDEVDVSEGIISVKQNKKWGLYNTSGTELVPPKFENKPYFQNGMARVKEGEREFYIDKKGTPQQ